MFIEIELLRRVSLGRIPELLFIRSEQKEPATQSEDSRDSFGSRRNSCSSQQEGFPLRRYPSSFDELVRVSEENEDGATRDLLIKEYIYCQTFAVREESRGSFEDHLDGYLRYMLNDLGMYFYKATWYCSLQPRSDLDGLGELPHRLYSIHFALFSNRHFTEPQPGQAVSKKSEVEAPEFLRDHLSQQQDYDQAHFRSKVMAEQKTITRSRDYRPQQMPEEVTAGSYTGLFKNPIKSFIHWWLIVPSVQYRFFDLLYQLYTFDIAHQGFWPKFLHMFTIHTNVICTMTFLAQWKFYESLGEDRTVINASFIYLSILIIAYVVMGFLRKSVVWGFTTAFVLVLCWAISNLWFDFFAVPGNPIYNPTTWGTNPLIWLYISSLVESTSHIMVPQLPPYITGVNHWESPFTFIKSGNWLYIIPSILSFVFFAPAVSYISHPHLVGTAIIVVMFGLGYHEEFYSEYKRMVMKAELCGNPAMDQVPIEFKDLIHGGPGNSGAPRQNPVEKIMFWTGIQRGPFDSLPAFLLPKQGVD